MSAPIKKTESTPSNGTASNSNVPVKQSPSSAMSGRTISRATGRSGTATGSALAKKIAEGSQLQTTSTTPSINNTPQATQSDTVFKTKDLKRQSSVSFALNPKDLKSEASPLSSKPQKKFNPNEKAYDPAFEPQFSPVRSPKTSSDSVFSSISSKLSEKVQSLRGSIRGAHSHARPSILDSKKEMNLNLFSPISSSDKASTSSDSKNVTHNFFTAPVIGDLKRFLINFHVADHKSMEIYSSEVSQILDYFQGEEVAQWLEVFCADLEIFLTKEAEKCINKNETKINPASLFNFISRKYAEAVKPESNCPFKAPFTFVVLHEDLMTAIDNDGKTKINFKAFLAQHLFIPFMEKRVSEKSKGSENEMLKLIDRSLKSYAMYIFTAEPKKK